MKISCKAPWSALVRLRNVFPCKGSRCKLTWNRLGLWGEPVLAGKLGWCLGTQTMATLPYRWDMRGFWSIGQLVSSKTRGPPWLILSRESNHSRIYFHFWYCDKTQPTHANKIISYREIFRAGHSNKAKFLLFQDFFCISSRIMWITRIFSLCLLS